MSTENLFKEFYNEHKAIFDKRICKLCKNKGFLNDECKECVKLLHSIKMSDIYLRWEYKHL